MKRTRAPVIPAGIYRVDLPGKGMDGWRVHISRKRTLFQKYFSNLAHGGERRALAAALRHRRGILRKALPLTRGEYAAIVRRNNTSGIPGVYRYPAKGRAGQWVAFWVPQPGERKRSAKFSVARHGEARAKQMAIAARQRALEEMTEPWRGESVPRARVLGARRALAPDARIAHVSVGEKRLTVTLRDARLVSVPLALVPKLQGASAELRREHRLSDDARTIMWPRLKLRLELKELIGEKF